MFEEKKSLPTVNAEKLDKDIAMLKTYLVAEDINLLLSALERLAEDPESEAAMLKVVNIFKESGILQGAVLTYATYLKVLLPQYIDSFGDN